MKAKEYALAMETLKAELLNEKRRSSSAMNLAKRASKEGAAIKRAIQSLGCRVNFTSNGNCTLDVEINPTETQEKSMQFSPLRESDGTVHDDKSDLSVSITVVSDDVVSSSPLGGVCETLCPLRTQDGSCQWPNAGCARLGNPIHETGDFHSCPKLACRYDRGQILELVHSRSNAFDAGSVLGPLVKVPWLDLHTEDEDFEGFWCCLEAVLVSVLRATAQ
ncbi:hypothetical protein F3Y22_tig00110889pilonHSYRG00159 [Hibiscus syriacus]|uniref:Uncharacterized protein n=1 Tax=Hibiscus syriacus TaxID=106335 RepID=A0A6A2ZJV3_HIBSY|nr:hypothetical protein F3Y22_tig00110889pilonHSYRG00159 [Hibiscus syriacus]